MVSEPAAECSHFQLACGGPHILMRSIPFSSSSSSIALSTCPGDCEGQQQYNTYGDEEPVYEEIQSRTTENCDANDYDDGGSGGGECSGHPFSGSG